VVILVLLAAVIGGVIYAVTHHLGGGSESPASGPPAARQAPGGQLPPPPAPADLGTHLDRWRGAGLISGDQAAAIAAHEAAASAEAQAAWLSHQPPARPVARPRRVPVVAEALGYLGGALAVAGLGLVLSSFWPDWSVGARFAVSAITAALLTAGGVAVRDQSEPALVRLRSILWLASTAATGLAAGVLVRDGFTEPAASRVALGVAMAVAVQSGALWRGRVERPLQQLTCLAGLVVAVGTLTAQLASSGPVGAALVATGLVLVALGVRRVLPNPELVDLVGGVTALVGAVLITNDGEAAGMLTGLALAFGLLALATVPGLVPARSDRIVFGVLGGFALFQLGPGATGYFAEQAGMATGLVAWALGAALVAVGTRRLLLTPHLAAVLGGVAMLAGAAVTGTQAEGFATVFGIATALGLVAVGMLPGQVLLSVLGAAGLLGFVPWAITWFFPGEGRVPVLILVSGVLILVLAVVLSRLAPRFREELRT
jgi:hypothetical protein